VNQDVDAGCRGELGECGYDGAVGEEVSVEVSRFNVEHVDKNTDVRKDMLSLLREVIFHERILTMNN